ncbi:MAG: hypothetical protein O3C05_02815, partial [Proteobacteria bacterium]|nr:hypothetical protein [Pseudomonadota bacterium]
MSPTLPQIGNLFLYIALCGSVISFMTLLFSLIKAQKHLVFDKELLRAHSFVSGIVTKSWIIIFLSTFTSLLCLIFCYINSDFSVFNVVQNSHLNQPLIYKITASWG